ncbi:hypothetical protein HDU98_000950 [Podochytrium sp. JEL0797]|nr:hypothetical protein HDU98_000950 [Podochytrium sp. JEL0797]
MTVFATLALLALGARAQRAPALFEGSNCNLDVSSFNGPNSAFLDVFENPSGGVGWTSGNVTYANGNMIMTMTPPKEVNGPNGNQVMFTSNLYLLYGSVEIRLKQADVGGAVTYMTMLNRESKDEIDLEWVGNEHDTVWTNMFYRGIRERIAGTGMSKWAAQLPVSDTSSKFHTYRVDWLPESITWSVDGAVIRTQNKSATYELAGTGDMAKLANGSYYDHYHYPDTPLAIDIGIWNDQSPIWGNGPINWNSPSSSSGFSAEVASVKVSCYTGPLPEPTKTYVLPTNLPTAAPPVQSLASPIPNGPAVLPLPSGVAPAVIPNGPAELPLPGAPGASITTADGAKGTDAADEGSAKPSSSREIVFSVVLFATLLFVI